MLQNNYDNVETEYDISDFSDIDEHEDINEESSPSDSEEESDNEFVSNDFLDTLDKNHW